MATIQEKIADSLKVLKNYQDAHGDNLVIRGANTLGRTHTQRLLKSGYLQMVVKGWYIPSLPGSEGDSTVWYVSYWSFVTAYLNAKYGEAWCLSPELSLDFHSGKSVIPQQLIVRSSLGANNILQLPFGTSLVVIKAALPTGIMVEPRYSLRIYPMEQALLMVGANYYRTSALEARTCLASLKDVSYLASLAIDAGLTTRSGRVAGALRSIGRAEMADELLHTMRRVGYTLVEANPFDEDSTLTTFAESPSALRIRLLWTRMRHVVLDKMRIDASPRDVASVLAMMDATYVKDSYNSLSIEGYKITEALLERVRAGHWNPDHDDEDTERRNTLAARGYYQAYELLKKGVSACFAGQSATQLYAKEHHEWHFQLFEPCVRAGIVKASELIGYRRSQVYIRNSMHTPMNSSEVLDAMGALSDLMANEANALVRAVLGHFFFVYIHPYMDGNGRTARFVMNSQLVTAGYPWVVVPVARRNEYITALECASVKEDIEPFVEFILSLMR